MQKITDQTKNINWNLLCDYLLRCYTFTPLSLQEYDLSIIKTPIYLEGNGSRMGWTGMSTPSDDFMLSIQNQDLDTVFLDIKKLKIINKTGYINFYKCREFESEYFKKNISDFDSYHPDWYVNYSNTLTTDCPLGISYSDIIKGLVHVKSDKMNAWVERYQYAYAEFLDDTLQLSIVFSICT